MAKKLADGTYACGICGKPYPSSQHADACRNAHDMIYVPMSRTELNRLINAIIINDTSLVPLSLTETLRKFARFQTRKDADDKS